MVNEVVVMVTVEKEEVVDMVVVEEVVVEVAEEGGEEELVVELEEVVEVEGMVLEGVVMLMTMMKIMICLNIRVVGVQIGKHCKATHSSRKSSQDHHRRNGQ